MSDSIHLRVALRNPSHKISVVEADDGEKIDSFSSIRESDLSHKENNWPYFGQMTMPRIGTGALGTDDLMEP